MDLRGEQYIGSQLSQKGERTFQATDAETGEVLEGLFYEATLDEADQAGKAAESSFDRFRKTSHEKRSSFLQRIADEIEALGDTLIQRAVKESGLPRARLEGERGRTCGQLRLFARVVQEGEFVEARIDQALPDRQPLPRPDIRMMNIAIGPVAVFGASNFPLAFSVAGGDTASAFAAGCPVIVKAHPAHPGTSSLVASAIQKAVAATNLPEGTFSMLHEKSGFMIAQALVKHPSIKAVGFTGSFAGGRALFDIAQSRPEPIPFYAEMGSVNPVFILPGALKENREGLAQAFIQSVTMGVGQFCTNPGVAVTLRGDDSAQFIRSAGECISGSTPGVMLHQGILSAFELGVNQLKQSGQFTSVAESEHESGRASAVLLKTEGSSFLSNEQLSEELFGPSSLIVESDSREQVLEIARNLKGHLTATIYGAPEELEDYRELIEILEKKVGRLIFNGFPTGVEVCDAMVHGGPFPATTDSRSTSVGTAAIKRFLRPVSYQNYPQSALPDALKDRNTLQIYRMINGVIKNEDL